MTAWKALCMVGLALMVSATWHDAALALSYRYSVVFLEGETVGRRPVREIDAQSVSADAGGRVCFGMASPRDESVQLDLQRVVGRGDIVGGHVLRGVRDPAVTGAGQIVFAGVYADDPAVDPPVLRTALFTSRSVLLRSGDTVGGRQLEQPASPARSATGDVVFTARVHTGGAELSDPGIYTLQRVVAEPGDIVDGVTLHHLGEPTFDASGEVLFSASPSPERPQERSIFGESRIRVSGGDVVDGKTLLAARSPSVATTGELAFIGTYVTQDGPRSAVFVDGDSVVAEGERVDGLRIDRLHRVHLQDSLELAFTATFEDGREGIVAAVPVLDGSLPVSLTAEHPGALLKLPPVAGRTAILQFTGAQPASDVQLFFRWGHPPSFLQFDEASSPVPGEGAARLILPRTRAQAGFVRVVARGTVAEPLDGTIEVEFVDLTLASLSASRTTPTVLQVAARGSGFGPATAFSLRAAADGAVIEARRTAVVFDGRAELEFDLRDAAAGAYDVVARNAGGTPATLDGALEVVPDGRAALRIELRGAGVARYNWPSRFDLEYENVGDAPMEAPIFAIEGPRGTMFSLDRSGRNFDGQLLALGLDPGGLPGVLPPGAKGSLPIYFRSTRCPAGGPPGDPDCDVTSPEDCPCKRFPSEDCTTCELSFRVRVFTPSARDYVAWEAQPPPEGIEAAAWQTIWPRLSSRLGASWRQYQRQLGEFATRLARRGAQAASLVDVFRFAVAEASGQPSAAIVGRLVEAGTEVPLDGRVIVAFEGATAVSSTVTDGRGAFSLPFLANGATYRLAMVDHRIVTTSAGGDTITLPPRGDLLNFTVEAVDQENDIEPGCAHCELEDLPREPLVHPGRLFTSRASIPFSIVSSWDPNDKDGPIGDGEEKLIAGDQEMRYTIYFENVSEDEDGDGEPDGLVAAAQFVEIVDVLDDGLDLTSFVPRELQIGSDDTQRWALDVQDDDLFSGYVATGPTVTASPYDYYDVFTVRQILEEDGVQVEKSVDFELLLTLDTNTRTLLCVLESRFDPRDPLGGFLLPNDELRQGEGHITFSMLPDASLAEGAQLSNAATISFDGLRQFETTEWVNTITHEELPGEPLDPSPANGASAVEATTAFQWQAERATSYAVRVWRTEGDEEIVLADEEIDTDYWLGAPQLVPGREHFWQVTARNENGDATGRVWSFEVLEDPDCPQVPATPSPPDGSSVATDRPSFEWAAAEQALAYEVYVWPAADSEPDEPLAAGLTAPRLDGVAELTASGEYRWRVVSLNASDCTAPGPVWTFAYEEGASVPFRRADVDQSGAVDITDAINLLDFLFLGNYQPSCDRAADIDASDTLDITDPILILTYAFLGGHEIPEPFEQCGTTADGELGCDAFEGCEE